MRTSSLVKTAILVASGVGTTALAIYIRHLYTNIHSIPTPNHTTESLLELSRLTSGKAQQDREMYQDCYSMCVRLPLSSSDPGTITTPVLTTMFVRHFFSSSLFQLEWFLSHHVFRVTPGSFHDHHDAVLASSEFLPGDQVVPGMIQVAARTPTGVLNQWRLLHVSGTQWFSTRLTEDATGATRSACFLFGSTINRGQKIGRHWLGLHQLYSRMLLGAAVKGVQKDLGGIR